MLSKRLEAIANEVPKGAIVADIGCDHGYLLIELVQRAILKNGFACDVNAGPLNSAAQNIAKFGYSEQLKTCLGNGVEALTAKDQETVDTYVIAGMGGALIRDIIQEHLDHPRLHTMILQPNIGADILREFLQTTDFKLEKELLVSDNEIIYPILVYKKDTNHHQQWTPFELKVGPYILQQDTAVNKQYIEDLKQHWMSIVLQLEKSTRPVHDKQIFYQDLIQDAKEWQNSDH